MKEWELLVEEIAQQTDLSEIKAPKLLEAMFSILKDLQKELRTKFLALVSRKDVLPRQIMKNVEDQYLKLKILLRGTIIESSAGLDERRRTIKLPTVELMKFNGEHKNWLPFKQLFESMVHNRK